MPNSAKAVANYFLERAFAEGVQLSPMKLLKLVYFAHGWFLSFSNGQPLIKERIEAWKFGPVVNDLYDDVKNFGNEPVNRLTGNWEWTGTQLKRNCPKIAEHGLNVAILNEVWSAYKGMSAATLSRITHEAGSPWDIVYNQQGGHARRHAVIPDELIKKDFDSRRPKERTDAASAA